MAEYWNEDEVLVRMRGKKDRLKKLVGMFVGTLPSNVQELEGFITENDLENARISAHTIKGAASNLSGKQLMESMAACEKACFDEDLELAKSLLPNCMDQSEKLTQSLKHYLSSLE